MRKPAYHAIRVFTGEDSGRASLAAVGTWHQQLLLFSLPALQPLLSQELGEVGLLLVYNTLACGFGICLLYYPIHFCMLAHLFAVIVWPMPGGWAASNYCWPFKHCGMYQRAVHISTVKVLSPAFWTPAILSNS